MDATDFFTAVASGTLPAVSFVKPDGLIDGSSTTSKLDLFEGMLPMRTTWPQGIMVADMAGRDRLAPQAPARAGAR